MATKWENIQYQLPLVTLQLGMLHCKSPLKAARLCRLSVVERKKQQSKLCILAAFNVQIKS